MTIPKVEGDSSNMDNNCFNSQIVKIDSFSNINSKEEIGIIKDLESAQKHSPNGQKNQKTVTTPDFN